MNIDALQECTQTPGELIRMFGDVPGNGKSAEAALHLAMAQSYVAELAHHLQDGKEMFDAVEATALGTLEIPPEKAVVFQILAAKPKA